MRIIKLVSLIFILFIAISCGGSGSDDQAQNPVYTNPILENDDQIAGAHWNDPHVLRVDNEFVMYASADISWDGYVKIYRLTSSNGVDFTLDPVTPVIDNSPSGWDDHGIETPAIVYFQGNYHMFYTGYDVAYDYSDIGADNNWGTFDDDNAPKRFKIGHAISADGINFTKQGFVIEPTDPYVVPDLVFNQYVVGEPAPVVHNNKIYLYFTSIGADAVVNSNWQVIGLMTFNGVSWDTPRVILKPDLALYPRDPYLGYSTPNAIKINNNIHLYYDVALEAPFTQVKIHHAVSSDGETGWVQDSDPLIEREDYTWTAAEVRSPSPLVYQDQLWLYYAGHVLTPSINLGIGLDILALP